MLPHSFRYNALRGTQQASTEPGGFLSPQVKSRLFMVVCALTALQPMFNSAAVGDYFSTGVKCDVSDPACYMQPKGELPGLNVVFAFWGELCNAVIAYVFFPLAYEAIKTMGKQLSKSVVVALLFGCAAAAVSFQLSRDSFALGGNQGAWVGLNTTLIMLAILPTFCSRFKGSYGMLSILWRIKPQISTLASYVYMADNRLAWAITARNDLLRSVYTLPPVALSAIVAKLKDGDYKGAIDYFYNGKENEWSGLHVSYGRSTIYWGLQLAFALISVGASFVVYNINCRLTFEMNQLLLARILATVLTFPATLYYVYSLSGLPDRMFRALGLACQLNSPVVWSMLAMAYVAALGSFGNLYYSGASQGLEGDFDWTGLSREVNADVAGGFGGAISALCNLFALLDIFERVLNPRLGLVEITRVVEGYEREPRVETITVVENYERVINDFMDKAKMELDPTLQIVIVGDDTIVNRMSLPHGEDAETASMRWAQSPAEAVPFVKNFYSTFRFSACRQESTQLSVALNQ